MAKKPGKRILKEAGNEMHSRDPKARLLAGRVLGEGRGKKRGSRKSGRK
jgi:hypothetical protein